MFSTSDSSKINIKIVESKSQEKIVIIEDNGDFVDFIFSFLTMPLGSILKLLGADSLLDVLPLNIPHAELPTYYYAEHSSCRGVTSKSPSVAPHYGLGRLTALDPRSLNRSKGVEGFVKRTTLYDVGDDLKVKPLSPNICLSYLKELNLPIDDLKVKLITIGADEALSLLRAFLTSKFTLDSVLQDI
ncbi:hypothetical protein P8452_30198 [Trifolium repens]|nr:hypothetical protein P8452_30198 [Trifolium repens]